MEEYIQVSTTCEKKEDAEKIAQALVEKELAACVQVLGPILSIYRWQSKIERAEEWLCLAKTKSALYYRVERAILEMHPYDTPEIIALPITAGSAKYLKWLESAVRT